MLDEMPPENVNCTWTKTISFELLTGIQKMSPIRHIHLKLKRSNYTLRAAVSGCLFSGILL